MLLCLQNLCSPEEVTQLRQLAAESEYADGRKTAGWAAREVKRNEQVEAGPRIDTIRSLVRKALERNALFNSFAQPKSVTRMLVSRYTTGMEYGRHVDDALMGGRRADLSFTLFLSDPDTYQGGELVMEGVEGETEIKLAPGEAVIYPTASLHRVSEVTSGERLAVVGWVRSLVRRPDQREVLFDLDRVCRSLFEKSGKTEELDVLLKTKSNLLRQWAED
ncbi:MAG: Fe2+-dependent dioxygenase [Alphaproteobacteria bacterium]|uniref:Fe2+-dependent dioxygenase n=1 Tax=Maricaulis alexandrii TaxID=2570354 RepID=UPI001108D849|nr:Fe2+-dependent dioxygenase [Maricaulis alexandrii]MCR9267917.1 Fe2+-dependent dioxygenase [Alphaproteobacteria bacterium]